MKTIHDPVHGGIKVDGMFLDLLDRHEMQRLRGVKQLGMANMVFPGANHTRFEHCLGAYYLAGEMADSIVFISQTELPFSYSPSSVQCMSSLSSTITLCAEYVSI